MPTPTPPESLANRLALALIASRYAFRVNEDEHFVLTRGTHSIFILWGPNAFERIPNLGAVGDAEVLLLGGTRDVRARLKKARPMLTQGRVYLFHVDDGGHVWHSDLGKPGKLGPLLRRPEDLPEADPESFATQIEANQQRVQAENAEVQSFRERLDARTPVATYVLAATIAVVYGLEHLWGGSDSIPTLVHMGALVREQALAEPWRLLSCCFLHAGFMHLAFNTFVLVALGRSLERLLGHERFVVLYVASALGGSLASTFLLGQGVSVGASGAIWGLLAAEAVLIYRPDGLLPATAIPALKRAVLINLGLNVANSLRPDVDWAAHFGGGLIGGVLLLTGVLTAGLPRLSKASSNEAMTDRRPGWLRPAAVALTALLAVGGVLGIAMGTPWAMGAQGSFTSRSLGATGLHVELPETLTEQQRDDRDSTLAVTYGDLMLDSMLASVTVMSFDPPLTQEEQMAEAEGFVSELTASLPKGSMLIGEHEELREGTAWYNFSVHQLPNGLIFEAAGVTTPNFSVFVGFLTWSELRRGSNVGLAERAVRSISF